MGTFVRRYCENINCRVEAYVATREPIPMAMAACPSCQTKGSIMEPMTFVLEDVRAGGRE